MIDIFSPQSDAAATPEDGAVTNVSSGAAPSMRQRLALSRKARLSSEEGVDGDPELVTATSNVPSKVKRMQKLSKNEQLMMEVYGDGEEKKKAKVGGGLP